MSFKNKTKPELLAPAGNLKKAKTALAFGADALYAGVPSFSLRSRINEFDVRRLERIIRYAHAMDRKVYVTVNIFAHNRHLSKVAEHIKKIRESGADGVIVSDPGVLDIVKKNWPKANIHLSTQANCTNWQAARFWYRQGVKRIISARETTLEEVKEIRNKVPEVELEYFVHGAMCMAYSGRCFLSEYFRGRSANLGDCAHPCRWRYDLVEKTSGGSLEIEEDGSGSFFLNSKDLCLIKHLKELKEAGIRSFKIEGRTKSVYYVATVVGAYRRAIDILFDKKIKIKDKNKETDFLYKELENKLVNRGYSTGFLLGNKGKQNIKVAADKSDRQFCGEVLKSVRAAGGGYKVKIRVHNSIKADDKVEILRPPYDITAVKVDKIWNAETGEEMREAHGGGSGHTVEIIVPVHVPRFSVLRKKTK